MNTLLLIILIIIVLEYILELILDGLNLKARKQPIPEMLSDVYPPDRYKLQQDYEVETTQFSYLQSTLSLVAIVLVLYFGLFGLLHEWIASFSFNKILTTLAFFAIIGFIGWLTSIPFSIWGTFVIEEKYGFNKTTPRLFVLDSIKSLLISFTVGGGLLAIITWIFYATQQWFWVIALGVMLVFSLLANALYSRVIVPLFNKQKPLEEGELLNAIKEFGDTVGFPVNKVFVIDGSKRSTKANAYFTGFGRNRRVVLYDTLIEKMRNDEIVAVLAHEIGHYRKHHIWINFGLGALQSAIILYLFGWLAQSAELSYALGFESASEPVFHLSLLAFGLLFSPIETILGLFTNGLSRKMEFQADAYAADNGLGNSLIQGLKKLSSENLSNLTPHPVYVFVNYSHPTLLQRIERIVAKHFC
jgi:STE24 endopeptidase